MAASKVRLTRRGRLAVTTVVAGAISAIVGGAALAVTEPGSTPVRAVIVQEGDSLWGIASRWTSGDIRAGIGRIRQLNALDGDAIVAGTRLLVPAGE